MNNEGKNSRLSGWLVESLRLTAFFPASSAPIESIWEKIAGVLPETESKQPRNKIIQEEGPWEEGKLIAVSAEGRIDLAYVALPRPADQTAMPSIGSFGKVADSFKKLTDTWLSFKLPTERLGIGLVLIQPVSDRVDGYRKLADYLPGVEVDPEGSRDFIYRINRPRPLLVDDINQTINRLSTWSFAHLTTLSVVQSHLSTSAPRTKPSDFAVRLEMDMNTDPEFVGSFDSNIGEKIIGLLIESAVEIGEKGDLK